MVILCCVSLLIRIELISYLRVRIKMLSKQGVKLRPQLFLPTIVFCICGSFLGYFWTFNKERVHEKSEL